ncbi:NADH-quinone oxidoreductase subunit J [Oscillochloris sp. ZM17-4]|uniref:NADH-quinone oxidoreductase subunit J family protein n=1 Tax=Oscillochloris sp. ZM17-4 TaxID=2866714 RepID=UPI001C72E6AD|nr:NADH-quinone oxidoreductase subunit J [Oscillochloris sp. ZM17-4]MBX0327534.1 NADH-quinone oxidoreductase subunit J [Oscillochloris sp. ZM17-4]
MDLLIQIIFGLLTALIIGAAMMVVTVRNIIHAALWLIASFFGVAALYLLLEAEFIAVVQVLVYIGAISILILFAIMLTRHISGEGERLLTRHWWAAAVVALGLFGAVLLPTLAGNAWGIPLPTGPAGTPEPLSGVEELGRGFVSEFLLHFEVAGVLLTVALIGAIVIAFEERSRRRRVLTLAEEHTLNQRQKASAERAAAAADMAD